MLYLGAPSKKNEKRVAKRVGLFEVSKSANLSKNNGHFYVPIGKKAVSNSQRPGEEYD